MPTTTTARPLYAIADEIRRDWGAKINYAARPYLDAMRSLEAVTDRYGMDTGHDMVAYFLSNATTWRGDTARRVKAELKAMIR
jgi:hypothetical protein